MESKRSPYEQLVAEVFGNAKGEKLMALWQEQYGDMISFNEGTTHAESAFRDGQRDFFMTLKYILK